MRTRNLIALGVFAVFYVTFGAYLTMNQEQVVYQPSAQDFDTCPTLATAERVNHRGTRMYLSGTDRPLAILYHGNAGSACDRAFYAQTFLAMGYDFLLVEYAGYSNDPLPPSHDRIKADVEHVIDFLSERTPPSVTLIGESIGTGVAAYHAALAPPERILLIAPFTDLHDLARDRFWFYPTNWLVVNAFDTVENLSDFRGPITIIHGTEDRIIPFHHGRRLRDSLRTTVTLTPIEGAGHNDLFLFPETFQALEEFLTTRP